MGNLNWRFNLAVGLVPGRAIMNRRLNWDAGIWGWGWSPPSTPSSLQTPESCFLTCKDITHKALVSTDLLSLWAGAGFDNFSEQFYSRVGVNSDRLSVWKDSLFKWGMFLNPEHHSQALLGHKVKVSSWMGVRSKIGSEEWIGRSYMNRRLTKTHSIIIPLYGMKDKAA